MQLPYANLQIKHQNPEATMPLTLPVQVICNTSDEQIYSNIRNNSHKYRTNWIKCEEPHQGIAVIVGSAPSMLDKLAEIRSMQEAGGKVFALNNAANILFSHDILADYQVLIDAREATKMLIGHAKEHLFASQVNPACFELVTNPTLWHLQVGDIEDEFPDYDDSYALIGGAASVGNTTTCLAYAMGYRDLQIFGMDSSHKDGESHAVHQAINDGDPCAEVVYNGKQYRTSITMKLQAERFQETAKALQCAGCTITLHGDGLLQEMWRNPQDMSEEDKYTLMWAQPEYRVHSPGELVASTFLDIAKPSGRIIDFGCGSGKGSLKLAEYGCSPLLIDFAENSRDEVAMKFPFVKHDLTRQLPETIFAKWGYCTDVMEHLPPEDVEKTILNIMECVDECFFQISTVSDTMGAIIGQELHLTIQPHSWWKELFERNGFAVKWEQEQNIAALFLIAKENQK